jgi:predicted alpha/beta hydrolase family esterase
VEKEFNGDKMKVNCSGFYVYASDNDLYVTLDKSRYVAEQLGAEFNVIRNARHFNAAAGYLKFERLLNDIKKLIK